MNTTKLIKPVITTYKSGDTRKLCSLKIPNNKAGELSLNVQEDSTGIGYCFISKLKNRFGKQLGSETFAMNENSQDIGGLYITVEPEYRNKLKEPNGKTGYSFGEILRLASIIEILENKIKNFIIHSKNTAIYFHSKYKFEPAITSFSERNYALESIINNNQKGYEDIVQKAEELLNLAHTTSDSTTQRELCKKTNKLLKRYITRVLSKNEYKNHPFSYGIQMVLTDETIQANRDFFNKLFKKHGIDYTI